MRRRRLVRGLIVACAPRGVAAGWSSPRSRWATSSRCATGSPRRRGSGRPTSTASHRSATARWGSDRRRGSTSISRARSTAGRSAPSSSPASATGADFRWLAYVATGRELGLHGAAVIGPEAWLRQPFSGWRRATASEIGDAALDLTAFREALTPEARAAAESRGVGVIEGARSRQCRIAIDGPTFRAAFPQVVWLLGYADLAHWRGQLDYWVFLDGQIGRIAGSVNGDAADIQEGALQATVRVEPDRDRPRRRVICTADRPRRPASGEGEDGERDRASATG